MSKDKNKDKEKEDDKKNKNPSSSSSSKKKKKPRISKHKEGRADHVIVRNLFAFSILRRLSVLTLFAFFCVALSIFSAFQIIKIKTPPQYIQLTEDGRVYPVAPLNQPNASDGDIIKFASESVKWINTYDYVNWRDQLQSNADRFSPSGWDNYITELVGSSNLNSVQSERMVVSPRVDGAVEIIQRGVVEDTGQYIWVVQVPASVIYNVGASSERLTQTGTVTLYITRVQLEISLRGYAIQVYQFDTASN